MQRRAHRVLGKFTICLHLESSVEIIGQRAADLAREKLIHRGDGSRGFVKGNAFKAVHGEENRGQAHALTVRLVDLADEMIERIQVDAAHGDSGGIDSQELAPDFFLGRVQADDNDGVQFHGRSLFLRIG